MKMTCVGCDKELELQFGFTMKECTGVACEVIIECNNCKCKNSFRKILVPAKVNPKEADKFFKEANKDYIG